MRTSTQRLLLAAGFLGVLVAVVPIGLAREAESGRDGRVDQSLYRQRTQL